MSTHLVITTNPTHIPMVHTHLIISTHPTHNTLSMHLPIITHRIHTQTGHTFDPTAMHIARLIPKQYLKTAQEN
jgi:hypothetical protein